MIKYIIKNFFILRKKETNNSILTLKCKNRDTTLKRVELPFVDKSNSTCLKKYFVNIKGLNTIERKIYS